MATTTFVDGQTRIESTWLNEVDQGIYQANAEITGSTSRTLLDKMADIISLKDFGAVGNGVTDDTTAWQTWITNIKSADKIGIVQKGDYLISGTVYNITSDFLYIDDGLVANIGPDEAAGKSLLLTGRTPDAGGSRINSDDRTLLGITLDITGAQHGNAARFNVNDDSACIDGSTCLYLHTISNSNTLWVAGMHSEIRHQTSGTTIGGNIECQSFVDTGTFIGFNIQYTNYTGALHPITGDPALQHSQGIALRVAGTTDDGQWKKGLYITENSILSSGSSIQVSSSATTGIHFTNGVVNTGADIFLESNSANGLVCGGTYTENAIRVNQGQAISLEQTGQHKILSGTNSPEGVVTAAAGSLYCRTGGGTGTSFYVKETSSGNTGWVAK
jgi:hypothetical protein